MNQQAYEAGKSAYQQGDWLTAVDRLSQAKNPGEVSGPVDHLVGNSYMKLGQYEAAAAAYESALRDTAYGKVGPLSCNRGRALLAAGHPSEAVTALTRALSDTSYATPYKAHMALGTAYERLGDPRNAGIAYRNAAIDESNPNPSSALCDLGGCFMQLGRPVDAVEAYRTALDFSAPLQSQNQIYCDLGLAYVAANRMSEAVDAFDHATADGTLVGSTANGMGARATYRVPGALPDVAEEVLGAYEARGDMTLVHADYVDLFQRVWSCVLTDDDGRAHLAIVDGRGAEGDDPTCLVIVEQMGEGGG